MEMIKNVAEILGYLVVAISLIVPLTPTPKDDQMLEKLWGMLHGIYKFLPTLGININTRLLEERLENKK